jgi:hypothetical protein
MQNENNRIIRIDLRGRVNIEKLSLLQLGVVINLKNSKGEMERKKRDSARLSTFNFVFIFIKHQIMSF